MNPPEDKDRIDPTPTDEPAAITSFLRAQAPAFGLDVKKMVVGQVIDSIQGDDSNHFAPLAGFLDAGIPEFVDEFKIYVNQGREGLIKKLEWEVSIDELYPELHARLEKVRDQVRSSDWTNHQEFRESVRIWEEEIAGWVKTKSETDPSIQETAKYYGDNWYNGKPIQEAFLSSRKNNL